MKKDVKAVGVGLAAGWLVQKLGSMGLPTTGLIGTIASAAAGAGIAKFGLHMGTKGMAEAAVGAVAMQAIVYPALQARGTPGFAGLRYGLRGATVAFQSPSQFAGLRGANVMIQQS